MKRMISAVAVLAVAAVSVFAVVAYAGQRSATATTVSVTAKEYKFILSRKSAPHGKVTFKIVNKGRIKHDFKIVGKKTKQLGHNKSTTLTVTLSKGKHAYICTVDSHAKFGMKGSFRST